MKGLYIHIPFCKQKCKYCDFVSFAGKEGKTKEYLQKLFCEMEQYKNEEINTVFIGGGTPSVLDAKSITSLMDNIKKNFYLSNDCEVTMEANPGTLCEKKIDAMLNSGINRISVGVQSFDDEELNIIGRIHTGGEAYNNICLLKKMGFDNINLDIMTALPYQTKESLKRTIDTATSLPVTHISAYSLIIEEGTPLEKEYSTGKLILPTDDEDRQMYAMAVKLLGEKGFMRYEISNFAKEGYECRHNIKYWSCNEYIGLGVAAHSYVGDKRYSNSSSLVGYLAGEKGEEIILSQNDKISEFMMMGLRMDSGVSNKEFKKRFAKDIEEVFAYQTQKFISLGLMQKTGDRYSLTERGIDVSNSVMCEFLI